jgi:hypothetical protein
MRGDEESLLKEKNFLMLFRISKILSAVTILHRFFTLFSLLVTKKTIKIIKIGLQQCFGSESELDPDSIRSVDPDSESGSVSIEGQNEPQYRKELRNFMF